MPRHRLTIDDARRGGLTSGARIDPARMATIGRRGAKRQARAARLAASRRGGKATASQPGRMAYLGRLSWTCTLLRRDPRPPPLWQIAGSERGWWPR